MKRTATLVLLLLLSLLVFSITGDAQRRRGRGRGRSTASTGKITVPCPSPLNDITDCPDTGCGDLDPALNTQKNTTEGSPDSATDITFAEFADLPEHVNGYNKIGDPREPLKNDGTRKGEGDMVRVVAWALDARPQNTRSRNKRGETCNCGFTGVDDPENTDVHIVLVDDDTLNLKAKAGGSKSATINTLKKREAESQTAEFTPRLRIALDEPFDGAKLKELIDPTNGGTLHVRVTGLLMYDSEHALGPFKLVRHTDWEVHPVFRLEFCAKNKTCSAGSDANWVDINK